MQDLLLQAVQQKWPDYDPSGVWTRKLIERKYSLAEGATFENVPEGFKRELVDIETLNDCIEVRSVESVEGPKMED